MCARRNRRAATAPSTKSAQDAVTFTGNVVVASDDNVIRGETLVLQIGNRRTIIRPNDRRARARRVRARSDGAQMPAGGHIAPVTPAGEPSLHEILAAAGRYEP